MPIQPPPKPRQPQGGLTLFEMLVTLAIVGIAAAVSIPNFGDLIRDQRLVAAANELLTSLTLARSTAITARAPAVICRTSSPEANPPICGTGAGWEQGWVVFTDVNGNGAVDAATDFIWERHPELPGDITIGAGANVDPAVTFQPIGTARGSNGIFSICDKRKNDASKRDRMRDVVLAFAGRARVEIGDGATLCR